MDTAPAVVKPQTLVAKFAEKYSIESDKLLATLKATAFKQKGDAPISNEQMAALMIVADQYGLNPFTKEIFAYPDKNNGIVPVVGVDGWCRIINRHPNLDGIEFKYSEGGTRKHKGKSVSDWIECIIRRKDRQHPIIVREYFDEVVREMNFTTPWDSHPNRMHRHKTLIQCARVAFGYAGIYDEDEAERIVENSNAVTIDHSTGEITQRPAISQPQSKSAAPAEVEPDPAKNPANVPAPPGQIKLIHSKLKGLAAIEEKDVAEVTKECLSTFSQPHFDGISVGLGNEILKWINERS